MWGGGNRIFRASSLNNRLNDGGTEIAPYEIAGLETVVTLLVPHYLDIKATSALQWGNPGKTSVFPAPGGLQPAEFQDSCLSSAHHRGDLTLQH